MSHNLDNLPALSVADALCELSRLASPPVVTLTLVNGGPLRGWIAKFDAAARIGILQLADPNGQRTNGAAYFDPQHVVCVTITNARMLGTAEQAAATTAAPISEAKRAEPGSAATPSEQHDPTPAPGRMELARAATELGARLTARLAAPFPVVLAWKGIDTASPRQMIAAQELLTLVEAELTLLLADANARRALTQKTRGLEIANGELRGATLIRDILRIAAPLAEGPSDRFDAHSLRVALQRVL